MKAVVMELREGKAAILDHNGVFRIIEDQHYRIGQVLEIPEKMPGDQQKILLFRRHLKKHTLQAAAAAAVILTAGGGVAAVTVPVTSITVEADTKLVYQLNLLDHVLSVDTTDSGFSSMDDLRSEVRGKRLDEAMDITLDLMSENGKIEEPDMQMNVTVRSHFGKEEGIEKTLEGRIERWNENHAEDKAHYSVRLVRESRPSDPAIPVREAAPQKEEEPAVAGTAAGGNKPGEPSIQPDPERGTEGMAQPWDASDSGALAGEKYQDGSRLGDQTQYDKTREDAVGREPSGADDNGDHPENMRSSDDQISAKEKGTEPSGGVSGEDSREPGSVWTDLPGNEGIGENAGLSKSTGSGFSENPGAGTNDVFSQAGGNPEPGNEGYAENGGFAGGFPGGAPGPGPDGNPGRGF